MMGVETGADDEANVLSLQVRSRPDGAWVFTRSVDAMGAENSSKHSTRKISNATASSQSRLWTLIGSQTRCVDQEAEALAVKSSRKQVPDRGRQRIRQTGPRAPDRFAMWL